MIYEVVDTMRVKTPKGELELKPGQIISLDSLKALKFVEMGKLTPQVTAARFAFLMQCMDSIWDSHALPLYKQGFRMTPAIKQAEVAVERLQEEVFQGKATLEDFRTAVEELITQIKKVNLVN
ncbi:MAG TPA: hypothetical protein PLR20_08040 [Syntrophales bacterium]|nr:hypothetical protein [Syntrophales bacterium]HPI58075.1 hypothetical protein [Syntrophales bacterium]HPN25291.1 hypothetical protein [Syntrophales bacterium]HQM29290.1 hypothetical protein [Syntrophales bacterium]